MHRTGRSVILALVSAGALIGCGGNDTSSATMSTSSQSKQQQRSDKNFQSDYATALQELYISYYGRPADPAGLAYWEGVLLADNAPTDIQSLNAAYSTNAAVKAVVDSFGNSAESQALYGTGDPTAFITAVYNNVLGRTPDPGGLIYWVGLIVNHTMTQAQAALAIIAAAAAEPSTSSDEQLVANRLAVAGYFTYQVANQNALNAYSGNIANATIRDLLDGVTATSDATAYQLIVNRAIDALEFHTLAANVSNLTIEGLVLTDGTDTIAVPANATSITFPTRLHTDASYNVSIVSQPLGFTDACALSNSSGTMGNANISNVVVSCHPAVAVLTTLAGGGAPCRGSYGDGVGTAASFCDPRGMVVDVSGNVYVADGSNNLIRKITSAGLVTTLAGSGRIGSTNGTGAAASFWYPSGVAMDMSGNVYVADLGNNLIRKITSAGVVTTLAGSGSSGSADGTGTAASFNWPEGVAVDNSGNVYVADSSNNLIRKITSAGVVTTLAGSGSSGSADGIGTAASFNRPEGVAVDNSGNVYVADAGNRLIRKITSAGVVTTLAGGNGTAPAASILYPVALAVDALGNIYVADLYYASIRKVTSAGVVTTLATYIDRPMGVAVDNSGNIYVAAEQDNLIQKISPQ
jgi:sugar lactone lactonase YvrE